MTSTERSVLLIDEGDEVSLEGELGDVLVKLGALSSIGERDIGRLIGVVLGLMVSGQKSFHIQMLTQAPDKLKIRVTYSTLPGVGWGVEILEDQPTQRTLQ